MRQTITQTENSAAGRCLTRSLYGYGSAGRAENAMRVSQNFIGFVVR